MKTIKILILSVLGNALELYNFTLYAIFATKIANVFFPFEDSIVSILASFGIFATGFITRPLGAIIFGHLGDKYGRKYALSISILLMQRFQIWHRRMVSTRIWNKCFVEE